jgi:hypothetical protein
MKMATTRVLQSFLVRTNEDKIKVSIRNHVSGNQYSLTENKKIWIRNFGIRHASPLDINNLYSEQEINFIINNELINNYHKNSFYEAEDLSDKNVFIISDGYGFEKTKEILETTEIKNQYIILTNSALRFWDIKRYLPSLYVVNNPFKESLAYLNKRIFPRLLASTKTYPEFFKYYNFNAGLYLYHSTPQLNYKAPIKTDYSNYLDDYRNPICAALVNCYYGNAKNIFLMSCSEGYKENKNGSILKNEVYQYPQQILADQIVDANIFWIKKNNPEINVNYFGINKSFKFARYIIEDELKEKNYV